MQDTGCGISEENKRRIFDVFFSTKGTKGTGLGLAVTRKIIQEHGGTLEVASEVGEGTSFTVSLPCLMDGDNGTGNAHDRGRRGVKTDEADT